MKLPYHPNRAGSRRVLFALGLSSSFLSPLHSAELGFSLLASSDNFSLGADFAVMGDLDDDGVADLAVSDPGYSGDGQFGSGIVYLLSGSSGQILLEVSGTPAMQRSFGASLAAFDANGDGVTDLAVGAPGQSFTSGALHVFSGVDFSPLFELTGTASSQLGVAVSPAGDQNGDGSDDLFVGAPRANGSLGAVDLISGADGSVLWTVGSDQATSSFGFAVSTVGDIDGDSKPDLAVAAPNYREAWAPVGQVSLIRSSDQTVAATISGSGFFNLLGYSMKTVDDINGDELPDLMIGSFSGGNCYVVSGFDLSLLVDLSISTHPAFQPLVAGGGLDDDGDGVTDWLVGSRGFTSDTSGPVGGFRMVSGADGTLLLDESADQAFTGLGQSLRVLPGFGFAVGEPSIVDAETGGRGAARFWRVDRVVDTDGDGIPDDEDAVPDSNTEPTIVLFGGDSGVDNRMEPDGTSLADRFAELPTPDELGNQGRYVSRLNTLLKQLKKDGLVSKNESKAIHKAAVQALSHRGKK